MLKNDDEIISETGRPGRSTTSAVRLALVGLLAVVGIFSVCAGPASAADTCRTELHPVDGDDGGVSGTVSVISSDGTVLTVEFRAHGEILEATRPLKEGEHAVLWGGSEPAGALWPGDWSEDHDYWENQYVKLAVTKSEDGKVCTLDGMIT